MEFINFRYVNWLFTHPDFTKACERMRDVCVEVAAEFAVKFTKNARRRVILGAGANGARRRDFSIRVPNRTLARRRQKRRNMAGNPLGTDSTREAAQWREATVVATGGRRPHEQFGVVNPAVYHASTILSPTLDDLERARRSRPGDSVTYGVHGTPGTFAFEEALARIEGGYRTRLCQSGLTAVAGPLLAYLSAGDHLLMTDSA